MKKVQKRNASEFDINAVISSNVKKTAGRNEWCLGGKERKRFNPNSFITDRENLTNGRFSFDHFLSTPEETCYNNYYNKMNMAFRTFDLFPRHANTFVGKETLRDRQKNLVVVTGSFGV